MQKKEFMSFKQFRTWCNRRAADGCWGLAVAMFCTDVVLEMNRTPFWTRRKRWETVFNQDNALYEEIVKPTNEKIEELHSQEGL